MLRGKTGNVTIIAIMSERRYNVGGVNRKIL